MNKVMRNLHVKLAREELGWAYPDLSWFSEEEARAANRQRQGLLQALSGWITYSFQGTKPHSGPLSPGCLICGQGGWGCNFLNGLCTRNCFYCPQDRSIKEERDSSTDGIVFKTPEEHVLFMETFQIRGVGFSGGEPLLVLDRVLAHIRAIRERFGNSIYLWMYTNGDQLDRPVSRLLREAGLDEIRFDLSARKYDLQPVVLAKEFFPTVTVEIPAIPEDCNLLKSLLGEMERVSVDFLNLHQLQTNEFNYKRLLAHPYHFLHQPGIPVFESEICALQLLLFAREKTLRLPINYCCSAYRRRFQGRDRRSRIGRWGLEGFEEITAAGYIRSFRVVDSPDRINEMIRRFREAHCPPDLWQVQERKTEVYFHRDLLQHIDGSSAEVAICYCEPGIQFKTPEGGMAEGNSVSHRAVVYQGEGWSRVGIESWRRLYVERVSSREVLRYFYRNYPAVGKEGILRMHKEAEELKRIASWEEIESGLPEVF
jgi:uncharacterized protein